MFDSLGPDSVLDTAGDAVTPLPPQPAQAQLAGAGRTPSVGVPHSVGTGVARQRQQRVHYRAAYLPEAEFAAAWKHELLDATMYRAHEDYRRELEQTLQAVTTRPDATACVVPLDVAGLLAYAEREGKDPASRQTRLAYSDSLHGAGRDVPWPPARNAVCWCGSAGKYKRCCGAPGFLAIVPPDPASLVLRVELDHVEPPVWRRITAPSNTPLDQVHQMIQAAMGWHDMHRYAFENDGYTIVDPDSDVPGISADSERLVSIATEPGQQFSYLYDFGDDWWHTVTLEEIRAAGPENTFQVLDGAGACPPENCGGPSLYLHLLQALTDPADQCHDAAVERFGEDYDPARYDRDRPH